MIKAEMSVRDRIGCIGFVLYERNIILQCLSHLAEYLQLDLAYDGRGGGDISANFIG
jgi:hypothetical protein